MGYIIACVVSFIPILIMFWWLRNKATGEEAFKKVCDEALKQGALSVFPVILGSLVTSIITRLFGLQESNPLLYRAIRMFIVIALVEELSKYFAFRKVLKNSDYKCSWIDMAILMTIVGAGFGLPETLLYMLDASVPVVLIRGICLPHAGYGFIIGYFHGKAIRKGNSFYKGIGFAIAWLMHGLYDFSLSEEFIAINDNLVFVPFILAFLDIVLVIWLIIFVKKKRKLPEYTEKLTYDK